MSSNSTKPVDADLLEYRHTRALEDLAAWKRFEASGRKGGISLDEVTLWLDSWGTDNELRLLPCWQRNRRSPAEAALRRPV